jgi:hypothetical protein
MHGLFMGLEVGHNVQTRSRDYTWASAFVSQGNFLTQDHTWLLDLWPDHLVDQYLQYR